MDDRFTDAEISAIRKLFAWMEERGQLSTEHLGFGLTGADADGLIVTEFDATTSYGESELDTTQRCIPWLALTDPAAYAAKIEADKAAREAERQAHLEAQNAEAARRQEAQERQAYEFLKAKYGP